MLLFYIYNVYSVYFLSQLVQMLPFISTSSHNAINLGTVAYGGLYALLLSLALYQIARITEQKISSRYQQIYVLVSHISAIVFALAGEIPFLSDFSLTPGCWKRLPILGKITIGLVAIAILLLCLYQLKRSWKRKQLCREFYPWCIIVGAWFAVWAALVSQDAKYTLHVHHALFAGLFASWFWDFSTLFDVVTNAIFMGIVIEGIDFYGISEFHLFIIQYSASISMLGVFMTWTVILIFLGIITMRKQTLKKSFINTALKVPLINL